MDDQDTMESIEASVERRLGFHIHLAAYILVNLLLIAIDVSSSPGTYWFMWPLFGWGVGVLFHGLSVFVFGDGLAIRKRMIDAELKRRGRTS